MRSKNKFYAVRNGRTPGVYSTWADCKDQVDGYVNARYKSFASLAEAEAFVDGAVAVKKIAKPIVKAESKDADSVSSSVDSLASARIVIYTDGSCLKNPGRGGYGAVIIDGEDRTELSGGFRLTTNNRMEMLACIIALQSLEPSSAAKLHTDSQYVVNSISKGWAKRWRKNGWRRDNGEVPNADLWQQLLGLCEKHDVIFQWVRGHAGNVENERCDLLARMAAQGDDLAVDAFYERK